MRHHKNIAIKRMLGFLLAFVVLFAGIPVNLAAATETMGTSSSVTQTIKDDFSPAPGIQYRDIRLTEEKILSSEEIVKSSKENNAPDEGNVESTEENNASNGENVESTEENNIPNGENAESTEENISSSERSTNPNVEVKTTHQAIRVMEIDVTHPQTFIELGVPSFINRLQRTTSHALSYHNEGHTVIGAINGGFFWNNRPMNLISKNNRLIHAGEVYYGDRDKYVNEPIAFGIDQSGKGMIDYYDLDLYYTYNGVDYEISGTNKIRDLNETILFSPYHSSDVTGTNQYGTEVVVELPTDLTLEFGTTVTGVVVDKREYGDESKQSTIPKNGFVLSGNGIGSDNLANVNIGDAISITVNIDDKWKNSNFMLASGSLLVDNGQVSISMNTASRNAAQITSRTAVALDKTGEKIYFITVDGHQSGYSKGMSLAQFADYLVELGVEKALNLDGGGSTTMGVRFFGSDKISLANRPSDGAERAVSTILMAISTAPIQIFTDVELSHWANPNITELYKKKTVTGYPDGSFKPTSYITRTEAAIMLTRELGLTLDSAFEIAYTDVNPTDMYYKEIAATTAAGLFIGREEGKFVPNGLLNRAEMAAIVQRAYNLPNVDMKYFPDVKPSHWAYDEINAIAHAGFSKGVPGGNYVPENLVTRAEFSAFLTQGQK